MDSRILLVERIPTALTGEKLYELFGAYGPLRQVRVGTDALSKGMAIVVFSFGEDANNARQSLHGHQLGGSRALSVTIYNKDDLVRSTTKRRRKREREGEYRSKIQGVDAA